MDGDEPTADARNATPDSAPDPSAARQGRSALRRHWVAATLGAVVILPSLAFTVWAGVTLSFSYSDGTRTGYVQKLSRKGWVCKTWEGEMAMTAQPGVAPVIFDFTVRQDSIADEITRLEGKPVTLHYEEHRGVPSRCFGETGHFVVGVTAVHP